MNILLIDNYDSFTYNLVQLVEQAGARVTVVRNDRFRLPDLQPYDKLILALGADASLPQIEGAEPSMTFQTLGDLHHFLSEVLALDINHQGAQVNMV